MAVVLLLVVPLLSLRRYRELSSPVVTDERREALQVRSVILKWALVPPLLVIWAATDGAPVSVWGEPGRRWLGVLLVLAALASAAGVATRLRSGRERERISTAVENVAALLPRTASERRVFAVAAVTAGVTEEIAYRAFLIAYLAWLLPGVGWVTAAVIAGVLFGAIHVYQGRKGVISTGLIGLLFGLLYADVGLVALATVHAIIDLRVLLLPVGPPPVTSSASGQPSRP
jgi:hypothetical protein